jgi:hypothetical protein
METVTLSCDLLIKSSPFPSVRVPTEKSTVSAQCDLSVSFMWGKTLSTLILFYGLAKKRFLKNNSLRTTLTLLDFNTSWRVRYWIKYKLQMFLKYS